MNTNILQILLLELTNEKLRNEVEFERIINSEIETNVKIEQLKSVFDKMVSCENKLKKFSEMYQQKTE